MKSQHKFSNVPSANIPRSSFNLSHPHKTTFDADYLVPICQPVDIIPGDTFSWSTHFFMRLATPLAPILDNMYFETFAFFVPYRLLWSNHEKFHGAQDDPGDSIDFTIPSRNLNNSPVGTLQDYFGIPDLGSSGTLTVSDMPFRAYNLIFREWFRDENLQDSPVVDLTDGASTIGNYVLLKRGKRHDYFTSCLPWPQKGTAVSLPLGDTANIHAAGATGQTLSIYSDDNTERRLIDTNNVTADISATSATLGVLYADLSAATASTINDIRLAFQTQRLLERDARSGTRYVEILKGQWQVTSPDFRLQRPEFLGGGSSTVNVTPVQQQSAQTTPVANDKLGNLAAYGTVAGSHSWTKSFVEHGVVIILGNVRGDITYSQGVDRYWSKSTRYDFFYPVLSGIGEQSVLNREIWADGSANDDLVFGYQERYGEYRFLNGKLTGLMRPDAAGTLSSWHLSEDFATLPTLGNTFIQANTGVPLDRAIAIPTEPHFIADFYHQVRAARPMPLYGVPGNLDRL